MADPGEHKAPVEHKVRPQSIHRRSPSSSSTHKSSSSGAGGVVSPSAYYASLPAIPAKDEKHYVREKMAFEADLYINNPSYCDFRLKVGDAAIGVSGIILATNSQLVQQKIDNEGCRGLDVTTLELGIDEVMELIKPLYTGRLVISPRNLLPNLMFSTLFQFTWIFQSCLQYFTENISPELVFDFLELCLRPQNLCLDQYQVVLLTCGRYLEEGNNMALVCNYVKDTKQAGRLTRDAIEYISKIDSTNVIDILSLILAWLKLDKLNMPIVPALLDLFDFTEVFKQNEELAESFFTHIITGDYSAEVRMRIMNLSFQSCRNVKPTKNRAFRMSRLKSVKDVNEK